MLTGEGSACSARSDSRRNRRHGAGERQCELHVLAPYLHQRVSLQHHAVADQAGQFKFRLTLIQCTLLTNVS